MLIEGWILDVYPVSGGMCVWMLTIEGHAVPLLDPWSPRFFLKAAPGDESRVRRALSSFCTGHSLSVVEKKEFFSNKWLDVFEARITDPRVFSRIGQFFLNDRSFTVYNADINLGQTYFYDRGLFPLARCACDVTPDGRIQAWQLNDSPWALDYALPPLRYAYLSMTGLEGNQDPSHRQRGLFTITIGDAPGRGPMYVMEGSEEDLLVGLERRVQDWDPDILLSDGGDGFIMQRLEWHASRVGRTLSFSRDPFRAMQSGAQRSFFSYGKMIYKAGTRTLFGRLHIDVRNSFMVSHADLDGLFEIARVARMPLQRAARATIGTSLSSMQHEWAIRNDYLIPVDKAQTEDFRSADELLASDRGGLVYTPEPGWHENVIEYDFSSMYPEIMVRHNITPEAVNCACCPDNKVPEINHHLCRRRIGLVPHVLGPVVEKRKQYKKHMLANHPRKKVFKARYDAFKWMLVTCFGYLGFRNARFGKIEAHECVNAYGREALLRAKETAERAGFHFIHAIVDSLWLSKPAISDAEIETLRLQIEKNTGLPVGFEGRYRWLKFFASRTNPLVGVPTRYLGAFTTGEAKVRGVELRRHDTPRFIKALQTDLIAVMSRAGNLAELKAMEADVRGVIESYRDRLCSGHVSPVELALTLHLSQEPHEYRHDTLSAIAAKKLAAAGIPLHAGEAIQYIVVEEKDAVKEWRVMPLAFIDDEFEYDRRYYERLLERAAEITPFEFREPEVNRLPGTLLGRGLNVIGRKFGSRPKACRDDGKRECRGDGKRECCDDGRKACREGGQDKGRGDGRKVGSNGKINGQLELWSGFELGLMDNAVPKTFGWGKRAVHRAAKFQ